MKPLKVSWFVDGDVSVDSHEDDDIDGAGHEGVDDGHLQMSLVEGNGVGFPLESMRNILEGRYGSDEDTEVRHGETQEVHVHHTFSNNQIRMRKFELEIQLVFLIKVERKILFLIGMFFIIDLN